MLNKLKKELIVTNMVFVSIVLFLMFATLVVYGYQSNIEDVKRTLHRPINEKDESIIKTIEFIFDKDGNIEKIVEEGVFYNIGEMKSLAVLVESQNGHKTYEFQEIDGYFYSVKKFDRGETIVTFVSNYYFYREMKFMVAGYVLGYIALLFVFYIISKYMSNKSIKPIEEAWNTQRRFIVDASHELKTPLAIISANNDILKRRGESTVGDEMQWIDSSIAEAEHMKKLVQEMLFLAKDDVIDFRVEENPVNLSDLVKEDILNFEALAFENGIELKYDIEDEVFISGSETEFKQLGYIMLDNALKYSYSESGKPVIAISLKKGESIVLKIGNTSKILDQDEQKNIFNRFYRVNQVNSTDGERGTGLGLAIAKSIVGRHGGTISVKSGKNCGPDNSQGTEFIMKF